MAPPGLHALRHHRTNRGLTGACAPVGDAPCHGWITSGEPPVWRSPARHASGGMRLPGRGGAVAWVGGGKRLVSSDIGWASSRQLGSSAVHREGLIGRDWLE